MFAYKVIENYGNKIYFLEYFKSKLSQFSVFHEYLEDCQAFCIIYVWSDGQNAADTSKILPLLFCKYVLGSQIHTVR